MRLRRWVARRDAIGERTRLGLCQHRGGTILELHAENVTTRLSHCTRRRRAHDPSRRALSSRSRQLVANGASGIESLVVPAPRWSPPSHSGSSSRRSTAQQRYTLPRGFGYRSVNISSCDWTNRSSIPPQQWPQARAIKHDVVCTQDVGIGCNCAATVSRTHVKRPPFWSTHRRCARPLKCPHSTGASDGGTGSAGSRRSLSTRTGMTRWITVLQKRLRSCCVTRCRPHDRSLRLGTDRVPPCRPVQRRLDAAERLQAPAAPRGAP